MQDYQRRVIDEKNEINERLNKLFNFIGSPTFTNLPEVDQVLLRNQARFMDGYVAVLEERIARFAN